MKVYVVGFVFFEGRDKVLLIRKNRPEWQAGLLNGIGGKVEPEETYREALVREIQEEAGITSRIKDWVEVCDLKFSHALIHFFACDTGGKAPDLITSPTDEILEVFPVVELQNRNDIIPNLRSLIPLAIDRLAHP
jgi:8-oxo-dGTP pyrophosphatase MutT (NUDIX family)